MAGRHGVHHARNHVARLFVPVVYLSLVLASCQHHRESIQGPESSGKFGSFITTLHNYGAIHNTALDSIRTMFTPASFPSFTAGAATTAFNNLDGAGLSVIAGNGVDTNGVAFATPGMLVQFTAWWPDTVFSPNADFYSTVSYYNNSAAIMRIVDWLDDTNPNGMTKLQYKTQLQGVCDSLMTALGSQNWVESELAFVQIVKSSLNYWYNFNDGTWGGTVPDAPTLAAVVQTDGGGFLVGWAMEAVIQIGQDGHFTASPVGGVMSSHEKARIAGGLRGAAYASGGGIVKMGQGLAKWISSWW